MSEAENQKEHIHDWEAGTWGVIIGVSRCRECGKIATAKDFITEKRHDK